MVLAALREGAESCSLPHSFHSPRLGCRVLSTAGITRLTWNCTPEQALLNPKAQKSCPTPSPWVQPHGSLLQLHIPRGCWGLQCCVCFPALQTFKNKCESWEGAPNTPCVSPQEQSYSLPYFRLFKMLLLLFSSPAGDPGAGLREQLSIPSPTTGSRMGLLAPVPQRAGLPPPSSWKEKL